MLVYRNAMPSPGGKGDREAVDEEWRHLTIRNAVHSNGTTFPNVPFSQNAYRFGTDRRSSSAPLRGHLPPGGRHCAAVIPTFSNIPEGDTTSYILSLISDIFVLRQRATARVVPAQRIINLNDCRWQSYLDLCPYALCGDRSGPSGNGQSVISHNPPVLLDRTGATIASKTSQFGLDSYAKV